MRIYEHPHQYYSRHSRMIRQIRIGLSRHSLFYSRNSHRVKGLSLIEVVIGSSLILLALTGLITAYGFYFRAGLRNTPELQAAFLLQEGAEALTLLRDEAWGNLASLSAETPYFLSWNGTKWVTTASETLVDGAFRRTVTVSDVYRRNSDKDIVASASPDAKTIDSGTKQLTVRVTAPGVDKQLTTYLTNLFE